MKRRAPKINSSNSNRNYKSNRNNKPTSNQKPKTERIKPLKKDVGERLNKYIAQSGICSRREADKYIESGLISVNGKIVTALGTKIYPGDKVAFNDTKISPERKTYILLNKPKDYVTTTSEKYQKNVIELIRNGCKERVYPVGEMDKHSTGLLLLTNDGELKERLTHPQSNKKKIYQVNLHKVPTQADLEKLLIGISLEDGVAKATEVTYCNPEDKTEIGIEINSNKNKLVRRMFESLGYKIKKLDRVYFAGLTKKNLPRGKWRFLHEKEIVMLKRGAYK